MAIATNLESVKAAITQAAVAAKRDPAEVHLIAVSKTKPIEAVLEAFDAGQMDFGENKVQEMVDKQPMLPNARWHLIGHLQTNKVKYVVPIVTMIHSLGSVKLLHEIEKQAAKIQRKVSCLIQINISNEDQKSGCDVQTATEILEHISECRFVKIDGCMGIAALTEDKALIRSQFKHLASVKNELKRYETENIRMHYLSMGMTSDFELAIAEGATHIRIGSAIFGDRNYA